MLQEENCKTDAKEKKKISEKPNKKWFKKFC